MISMPRIQSIRQLRRNGKSIAPIARKVGAGEPTVRKYLEAGDLSPKPPVRKRRASAIDEYVPAIEQWLAEDRETRAGAAARREGRGGVAVDRDQDGGPPSARVRRGTRVGVPRPGVASRRGQADFGEVDVY